jgi:hypothetical protein
MTLPVLTSSLKKTGLPQIAFVRGKDWLVVFDGARTAGNSDFIPMPRVNCPVFDVIRVDPNRLWAINKKHITQYSIDIENLIKDLLGAGASLTNPV